MRYLKKFNESENPVDNSVEYNKISNIIKEVNSQIINLTIKRNEEEIDDDELVVAYSLELNGDVIKIEDDIWTSNGMEYDNYLLTINGDDKMMNKYQLEELYDHVASVQRRSNHLIDFIHKWVQRNNNPSITAEEIKERCLEFELTKDNKSIDIISLQQIYEYYGLDWNIHKDRSISFIKNNITKSI